MPSRESKGCRFCTRWREECNMALAGLGKVTVEPVLCFYMFSIFMTFPILQQLAFHKICDGKFGAETCKNLTKDQENVVHSKTSEWILYQSVAVTLPSIGTSLILGSWSDNVGRKVILLLPCIGSVLLYISHILNVVFISASVNYLLIGVFISSFFGGFATVLLGVFSYISDITDKSQRTVRVAILESMIFLGGTAGNLIGGELLERSGYLAAFGLALGLNIVIVIYVLTYLKESFFSEESGENKFRLVAIHNHLKASIRVLSKQRPMHQRMNLLVTMLGIFSILMVVFGGFNDLTAIYSKHSPRNFTPSQIGFFFAEVLFLKGMGAVLGIPVLSRVLKLSDLTIAMIGVIASIVLYVVIGLASSKGMMFSGAIIALGAGMPPPCLRSWMSKQVEPTELGTTFAVIASFEVLETLLASVILNSIYSYTVDWFPGFSFLLMAGILLIPFVLLLWLYVVEKRANPYMAMASVQSTQEQERTDRNAEGTLSYQSGSTENDSPNLA